MSDDIRWSITDPLGNKIVLKNSTFDEHIIGDHCDKDGEFRKMLEPSAQLVLASPSAIIKDGTRKIYYDLIALEQRPEIKIRILKVVVEDNGEIVTWTLQRKGDSIPGGELIYGTRVYYLPS